MRFKLGQKDHPNIDLGSFEAGLRLPTKEELQSWRENSVTDEWYLTPGELKLFQLFMNHRHEAPLTRRQVLVRKVIQLLGRWA